MCDLLDESLESGATGFSSGLMYAPGSAASADELIALARVAARKGAVYSTHMRSYSAGLVDAVEEQIQIAKASGCRLQISHLQAAGEDYWPMQQMRLPRLRKRTRTGSMYRLMPIRGSLDRLYSHRCYRNGLSMVGAPHFSLGSPIPAKGRRSGLASNLRRGGTVW